MGKMIFWGATGQAKVLKECLKDLRLELVALFDNNEDLRSPFPEVPLYFGKQGFEDWMAKRQDKDPVSFLVAIGGFRNRDRIEIQEYLESRGLIPLIARHPTAFIANNVKIGAGSQILAHSTVCVETTIGRACIINTSASVDHECQLQDGVHVGPGVHIAGCVEIGYCASISTGAIILPRIKIGTESIVGAGAVIIEDVPPYTVVVGNPGRVLKKGEK